MTHVWLELFSNCVVWPAFFLLIFTFPTGQVYPRKAVRWVTLCIVILGIADALGVMSQSAGSPGPYQIADLPANPLFWPPVAPYYALINGTIDSALAIVAIVVSATLLILRYRAAQPREREQIKWFLWVGIVCGVTGIVFTVFQIVYPNSSLLTSPVGQAISFFFNGAILAFPATAISVAILRNRLWDIDVLINRTLVYGTLTVLLAGLYFGLIFGLQFALQGILPRNNDIVTVISTLATASLFPPLRRRIQQRIDRRFYRHKYDATRTLEAFSAALRSEVDLVQLDEHLRAVVQETMQPAQVRLWLRPASHEKAPTA